MFCPKHLYNTSPMHDKWRKINGQQTGIKLRDRFLNKLHLFYKIPDLNLLKIIRWLTAILLSMTG